MLGGVGAASFFFATTQCEAVSVDQNKETCSIDDALGQIDYELKESKKVNEKHVVSYSCAAYRANKPIEDRYDFFFSPTGDAYFAVFDGHGGWQAAEYVQKNLIANTYKEIRASKLDDDMSIIKSLIRGFERTDRDLLVQVRQTFDVGFGAVARVGSCGLLVYIHENQLFVANAGDVRVVLAHETKVRKTKLEGTALSHDHNAKIQREKKRLALEHPGEDDIVVCKHPEACYVKGRLQPTR